MEPFKKTKTLVGIIIFLLMSNLAMLVFFVVLGNGSKKDHGHKDMIGSYLKKDIGFDETQMANYEKLHKDHMTEMTPFFDSVHSSKDNFYHLLVTDTPDSALAEYAAAIGQRQVQLDMHMFKHLRQVRSLCTPQQLPKFDTSFHTIITRMTQRNRRTSNQTK